MRIAIGCDRYGFEIKEKLMLHLTERGHEVIDCGTHDGVFPVDYPIYGERVGKAVASGACAYGVAICGTGTGVMIAANKIRGIRCGVGYSDEATRLMREHTDANVITFGQRFMSYEDIERRVDIFLTTDFMGLHQTPRVEQIKALEDGKEIHQTPLINPL